MSGIEEAARQAAERWRDRDLAKRDLREAVEVLLTFRSMSEIAEIINIPRTTLYYFMYGRGGKGAISGTGSSNLRGDSE